MARKGPGLLLAEITGDGPRIQGAVRVLAGLDADVIVLTKFDYDARGAALSALADRLATAGQPYPYRFALAPNSGVDSGVDLDGDGKTGGRGDAQGWGVFPGQKGMAILSRLPIRGDLAQDYSGFLWADLPGNLMPEDTPAPVRAVQRLSSTGHWAVPVELPDGRLLTLLSWYATPPVFDGPEDRNGRRNHDEAAFWLRLLDGALPGLDPPEGPFVLIGQSDCDPADGDGRCDAVRALLSDPRLQDPAPRGKASRTEPGHQGDPALDTALYRRGIGGLRVDLILPAAGVQVTGSGIVWPLQGQPPMADLTAAGSDHFPVWVDLAP